MFATAATEEQDDDEQEQSVYTFGTQHPKYELNHYYKRLYPDADLEGCFRRSSKTDDKRQQWWTCHFTCPVYGTIYPSGSLKAVKLKKRLDNNSSSKAIYYKKLKLAERATSARFMDIIQFQQTGQTQPRLCLEDPSEFQEEDFDSEDSEEEDDTLRDDSPAVNDETQVMSSSPSSTDGPHDVEMFSRNDTVVPRPPPRERKPIGLTWYRKQDDDDTDESISHTSIQQLPSTTLTTMERIMNTWANSLSTTTAAAEQDSQQHHLPLPEDYTSQRQAAIDDAMVWFQRCKNPPKRRSRESLKRKVFYATQQTVSMEAAKALLAALAHSDKDVQSMANEVMNHLREEQSEESGGILDIETYNLYLKCLGGTPEEAAKQALEILNHMQTSKPYQGHVLPKPNVETFNTVIQSCGRVGNNRTTTGGPAPISMISKIYNSMLTSNDVQPNRTTFLSILSSMTNNNATGHVNSPTRFDAANAKLCIFRSEKYIDAVDTDLYNAPLKWSHGVLDEGRSYAPTASWDRHDLIFQNGFKPYSPQDALVQEANQMETWVHGMGRSSSDDDKIIAPDNETLESLIQAWVRTGTLEGLAKAETWATLLLQQSDNPRLQSFHPILAAWAFSGDVKGPDKVLYRTSLLSNAGITIDGRIRTLPILAWRARQQRLVEEAQMKDKTKTQKDDNDDSTMREETEHVSGSLLELAQSCSTLLDSLCNELCFDVHNENPAFFLDCSVFEQVVDAWRTVLVHVGTRQDKQLSESSATRINKAMEKIFETVKSLDDTIHVYGKRNKQKSESGAPSDSEEEETTFHRDDAVEESWRYRQLYHLLQGATRVNVAAVSILNEIDEMPSMDAYTSFFLRYFHHAELMLRRSEEYRHVLNHGVEEYGVIPFSSYGNRGAISNHDLITYSDMYSYTPPIDTASGRDPILSLYSELLTGCETLNESYQVGDVTRICMFILHCLTRDSDSAFDTSVEADIMKEAVKLMGGKITDKAQLTKILSKVLELLHSHRREATREDREPKSDSKQRRNAPHKGKDKENQKLDITIVMQEIDHVLQTTVKRNNRSWPRPYPRPRQSGKAARAGYLKRIAKRKARAMKR